MFYWYVVLPHHSRSHGVESCYSTRLQETVLRFLNNFSHLFASASLASSLSDDFLTKATVEVVGLLKRKAAKPEMTRTNIQMIGALRSVDVIL